MLGLRRIYVERMRCKGRFSVWGPSLSSYGRRRYRASGVRCKSNACGILGNLYGLMVPNESKASPEIAEENLAVACIPSITGMTTVGVQNKHSKYTFRKEPKRDMGNADSLAEG